MLPEEFFSSMATSIGVSFFIIVAIIQGIGYVLVRKGRGKGEKDLKLFKKLNREKKGKEYWKTSILSR